MIPNIEVFYGLLTSWGQSYVLVLVTNLLLQFNPLSCCYKISQHLDRYLWNMGTAKKMGLCAWQRQREAIVAVTASPEFCASLEKLGLVDGMGQLGSELENDVEKGATTTSSGADMTKDSIELSTVQVSVVDVQKKDPSL
mgnify:CR=1 FL=1